MDKLWYNHNILIYVYTLNYMYLIYVANLQMMCLCYLGPDMVGFVVVKVNGYTFRGNKSASLRRELVLIGKNSLLFYPFCKGQVHGW